MSKRTILLSLYLFFLLGMGWIAYQKPLNNWDAIAYSAVVLQYNHAQDAHLQAYHIAGQQLLPINYNQLTSGNHQRKLWAADAKEFNRLMPFYVVKPLYTRLAWLFYKGGLPLFKAVAAPSILAYTLTGLLFFIWLGRYLSAGPTFLLSLIMMLLPNILEAARLSTPDFLFAFLILSGIFFISEKKHLAGFFISFMLAMFCRIDGIIPFLAFLIFYTCIDNSTVVISRRKFFLLTGTVIIGYFIVSFGASAYGWNLLYFSSFFKTITSGYSSSFSWHGYIELVKAQLFTALFFSHISWFFFLGVIPFIHKNDHCQTDKKFLLTLLIVIAIRFILQPVIADRFYLPYYSLTLIFIVRYLAWNTTKVQH